MSYSTCVAAAMRLVAIGNLQSDDITCNPHTFPLSLLDLIVTQILWPTRTFGTYILEPVLPIPIECICRMTCSEGAESALSLHIPYCSSSKFLVSWCLHLKEED